MKKFTILTLVILALIASPCLIADDIRYAEEVGDTSKPYSGDWIVSPDEEPYGDEDVSNAPECDIRGVISSNDEYRLRVDILLHNPISYEWQVCYAVEFEYINNVTEAYLFFPVVEKFFYVKWQDEEVIDYKELYQGEGSDSVGVTSSDDGAASSVYLIIDKDKHLAKDKYGKKLWLSARFYSGYLTEVVDDVTVDELHYMEEADATIKVKLGFIR